MLLPYRDDARKNNAVPTLSGYAVSPHRDIAPREQQRICNRGHTLVTGIPLGRTELANDSRPMISVGIAAQSRTGEGCTLHYAMLAHRSCEIYMHKFSPQVQREGRARERLHASSATTIQRFWRGRCAARASGSIGLMTRRLYSVK